MLVQLLCFVLFRLVKSQNADFHQLSADDIQGNQIKFSQYEGKAVLVVNVASQCGYTEGHYKGLKRLFDILNYSNKLAILAFPCNQFGGQEPGTRDDIKDVAFSQYGVRFTLMDKVDVKDDGAHPVWRFLTGKTFSFNMYL